MTGAQKSMERSKKVREVVPIVIINIETSKNGTT